MSRSSNLATMIVVSLLSYNPSVGAATRSSSNEHDEDASTSITVDQEQEATMLLHHASAVLVVTFAVATSLQLSPLELIRNNNGQQGNNGIRMERDPLRPLLTARNCTGSQGRSNGNHKSLTMVRRSTSAVGRSRGLEFRTRQVVFNSRLSEESRSSVSDMSDSCDSSTSLNAEEEEEGARTLANLLANVDFADVKNSWTKRVQMPRTCNLKSLLHAKKLLRKDNAAIFSPMKSFNSSQSIQSIPKYANVPEVPGCDSLLSLSSDFSSLSTRGSIPSFRNMTIRKTNFNNVSSQRNAEWEIIE